MVYVYFDFKMIGNCHNIIWMSTIVSCKFIWNYDVFHFAGINFLISIIWTLTLKILLLAKWKCSFSQWDDAFLYPLTAMSRLETSIFNVPFLYNSNFSCNWNNMSILNKKQWCSHHKSKEALSLFPIQKLVALQ